MIQRWLAIGLAVILLWPCAVAAEDLSALYARALQASQNGDFVQGSGAAAGAE